MTLRQRAAHELKEIAILTVYLYVTLGAVILMKVAVLHDAGISFVPWGIAAVKALVLAKFMLLGLLHRQSVNASLGELTGGKLYKTLAGILILLLVLIPYFAFHVLDEALGEGRLARMFLSSGGGMVRHLSSTADQAFLNQTWRPSDMEEMK